MDTILVIDDDATMRDLLADLLARPDRQILKSGSACQGLEIVQNETVHLILTDINMPEMNGIQFIKKMKELHVTTPIITITAFTSTDTAIQALRAGAYDYLSKPFVHEELLKTVENTLQAVHLFQEVTYLRGKLDKNYKLENIIGQCPAMLHLFDVIERIRDSQCNVLLTGPSGTGKDLVARAIHNTSCRKEGPFIPINCSSIPEMLLESELFGHTRGAFTGAVCEKMGLIEAAHAGTLFLDEIGDMPITLQPKLLRVLQDHVVQKVGSTQRTTVDIRVIAATNRNLHDKIHDSSFRKDLYYRLSVLELNLPALKDRGDDVSLLACHFLKQHSGRLKSPIKGFSPNARKAIDNYPWPGNIRELENAIEHAVTLCRSDVIDLPDLPRRVQEYTQSGDFSSGTLDERIQHFEHHCLKQTLEELEYDFNAAAGQLGISLPTLYRKAKKQGLSPKGTSRVIDIPDTRKNRKEEPSRQPRLF
jgi:DNA-binding NtrC family response regulator